MKKITSIPANRFNFLLILILLISIALRVFGINSESLWFDEAYSIHLSKMNLWDLVRNTAEDVHPPLYYITLNLWEYVFGESETSSRMLSALFNVLTVYVIYRISAYLYDKKTGLIAAFLLAISPFHIYYSQEARMYALLGMLSILSIYSFIKLATEINNSGWRNYVLFSVLMLYTHVYGFWILCFETLFILVLFYLKRLDKRKIKALLISAIMIVIAYLPWTGILLSQLHKVGSGFWIPPRDWLALPETLISFSGSLVLFFIFILLLLTGFFFIKKIKLTDETGAAKTVHALYIANVKDDIFLWMWFVIPIIIPLLISQFYEPIFDAKYAIAASLGLYILIARAVTKFKLGGFRPAVLSLIFLFSLIAVFENVKVLTKERWRDAINYVNAHAENTDYVVVNAWESDKIGIFNYYLKPELDSNKILIESCTKTHALKKQKLLNKLMHLSDKIWFIKTGRDCASDSLLRTLSANYELVEKENFPSIFRRYMFQAAYGDGKKDVFLEKTTLGAGIETILLIRKETDVKYAENN